LLSKASQKTDFSFFVAGLKPGSTPKSHPAHLFSQLA
jgi:hypothetical protein